MPGDTQVAEVCEKERGNQRYWMCVCVCDFFFSCFPPPPLQIVIIIIIIIIIIIDRQTERYTDK